MRDCAPDHDLQGPAAALLGGVTPSARRATLARVEAAAITVMGVLQHVLSTGPPLRLAILFGSAPGGRARPDSDLDVGIMPDDPDLPLHTELELQSRLERACGRSVDLVRLDRASTILRWEAARRGVPILARSRTELLGFIVGAALEHADLAPLLSQAAAVFRERLIDARRRSPEGQRD